MIHTDPRSAASTTELRSFGLLVGTAFAGVAGLVAWRTQVGPIALVLALLSATLILAGAISPGILATPYRFWMGFALLLSRITTPIFMAVVYFLVLTPIGLLMRALGKNPLEFGDGSTHWITRTGDSRRSILTRQF